MDTLTHSLVGVLAARSYLPERMISDPGKRRPLLFYAAVAAAFPDIDYLSMPIDPLSFIADWHRGPTHSLVMLPFWALLHGWLFSRWAGMPENRSLYTAIAAVSLTSHIATDVITAWGSQIFWPLSDFRAALGTTFVIDPFFTGIVLLGLFGAQKRSGTTIARWGLAMLLAYVGFNGWLKLQAEEIAGDFDRLHRSADAQITALPQPLSPSRWKLVVSVQDRHHIAYLDFVAKAPARQDGKGLSALIGGYGAADRLIWDQASRFGNDPANHRLARQAWQQPAFDRFRRFARIPQLYRLDQRPESVCVWFADARYILPGLPTPFRYGMCREQDGSWRIDYLLLE